MWYAPSAPKCHVQLSYHRDSLLQRQKETTASFFCFGNTLPPRLSSQPPAIANTTGTVECDEKPGAAPWHAQSHACTVFAQSGSQEQRCGNTNHDSINPGTAATVLACLFRQWAQSWAGLQCCPPHLATAPELVGCCWEQEPAADTPLTAMDLQAPGYRPSRRYVGTSPAAGSRMLK